MNDYPFKEYRYNLDSFVEILNGEGSEAGENGTVTSIYTRTDGQQVTLIVGVRDKEGKRRRLAKRHRDVRPASREDRIEHGTKLINLGMDVLGAEGIGVEINTKGDKS
jgi:hypothetical protein